ncbi:MAG TPA: CPBP family intramembrane glutamic endopeptidase [Rhizomicrobium sp.]|nr:CPBP family intramembrane glutamic endopeptidase [Rhizomicrobium sp.]
MNQAIVLEPEQAGGAPISRNDALAAVLWAVVIPMGVAIVVATIFLAGMIATTPGLSADRIVAALESNFYFTVAATTAGDAVVFWVLWRRAKRFSARPLAQFLPAVRIGTLLWAAASAVALVIATAAVEIVLKRNYGLSLAPSPTETAMMPKSWTQLGLVMAAFAVFVPLFEEVLFRGFVLGWLKRVTPVWFAILASAAIFALFHGLYFTRETISGLVGTGEIFVMGVLLAWWAAHAKSLWPSFVVHFVANAAAFSLAFFLPGWP